MKDDLALEKEFNKYKELHKYTMIQAALQSFSDTIYSNPLFKEFKYIDAENADEKAEKVTQILFNLYDSNPEKVETIYEYCWLNVRKYIRDDKYYTKEII